MSPEPAGHGWGEGQGEVVTAARVIGGWAAVPPERIFALFRRRLG